MTTNTKPHQDIQSYYGKILETNSDLKTNACCPAEAMPQYLREIAAMISPEVIEKFYGCGSPIPEALEGCTVLDLGCGTGRDSFLCARLVGEKGLVIGIDMTGEQIAVAKRHEREMAARFGYAQPNTAFLQGYMEDLAACSIEESSVDVAISNCVLNLAPDKERVFREIFRVLRPAGELYFSDIFADRRIPEELANDPVLLGECLGGAMYLEDFRRMLTQLGIPDFRVVSRHPVTIGDPEIERRIGFARFESMTIRVFNLGTLEDQCEDYGQVATYRGTVPDGPHRFVLDDHHVFETGRPATVCGNTASMLAETRFGRHFRVDGDRSRHFGLFPCGPAKENAPEGGGASCC